MLYPPSGARILVAMSGGVDSAVAAALLVEQGYACIGVTMRLVPEPSEKSVFEPCCSLEAAHDAQRVCQALGIPHHIIHLVDRFDEEIVSNFLDEYITGRTPNPCVRCNRRIKFGALYEQAAPLGAQYIAMGHFAQVECRGDRLALRRGQDLAKDQSYVLAALTQDQLTRACFPVGAMTKSEVRAIAQERGLPTASKAESQEICFIPDQDYARFVEERRGISPPGPILSVQGKRLGQHRGLIHYTIGQRRGLGIAAERPYYVVRLDRANNALIIGFSEETLCRDFTTGVLNWSGLAPQSEPVECLVQLRSHHRAAPGTLIPGPAGASVVLHTPQRSVTPGQWAVFYAGDSIIAAGIIEDFTALLPQQ